MFQEQTVSEDPILLLALALSQLSSGRGIALRALRAIVNNHSLAESIDPLLMSRISLQAPPTELKLAGADDDPGDDPPPHPRPRRSRRHRLKLCRV